MSDDEIKATVNLKVTLTDGSKWLVTYDSESHGDAIDDLQDRVAIADLVGATHIKDQYYALINTAQITSVESLPRLKAAPGYFSTAPLPGNALPRDERSID